MKIYETSLRPNATGFGWSEQERVYVLADDAKVPDGAQVQPVDTSPYDWRRVDGEDELKQSSQTGVEQPVKEVQ